ncbi:MAG: hypothetical protein GXP54_05805 [Deltaproteobacteria bacterium]|nr:hypothetical protein [Deltaproteobacteria bacterium]
MEDPIFAESLDDSTLSKLKAELLERSIPMRDRVMEQLSEDERWLAGLDFDGPGKSFAENERLWAPTVAAVELAREVLNAYGFPESPQAPADYRMPTWFINGKYLPGLAEKYWGLIAEVRDIRTRIREVEENSQREALRKRWDSIGAEGGI